MIGFFLHTLSVIAHKMRGVLKECVLHNYFENGYAKEETAIYFKLNYIVIVMNYEDEREMKSVPPELSE